MFGEEQIIGENNITLGDKNRIVLPKFTKAEPYDILVPHFNRERTILYFYSSQEFYQMSEKFENALLKGRKEGKLSYSEVLKLRRFYYATLSFGAEAVDSQRRVLLDKRIISQLQLGKQIFVIGQDRHLELCRDKETYQLVKKKTYQKER